MLNSWGYSSMGFGVCGVLGAQLAAPDRPCVAVVGDGGFTMTPYVVCTAVEYDLPCVWIVWNNFAWGAIRDIQYGMFGGRELGTAFYKGKQGPGGERYNPDFAAWARACGADGVTVTRSEDLGDAVAAGRAQPPALRASTCTSTPKCVRRPPAPGSCRRRRSRNRCSASRGSPDGEPA